MTVTEAAYVKTLQNLGKSEKKCQISCELCVNLRSFYEGCDHVFGLCMNLLDTVLDSPAGVLDNFQSYAQKFFTVKKRHVEYVPLFNEVIEDFTGKTVYQCLVLEQFKAIAIEKAYIYSATYILDVSKVFLNSG